MSTTANYYMSKALTLAEQGRYTVSPNPMVGCLIVKNQQIVASGYHQRAGEAHAEIHALQQANDEACGSTVYVTLEPCCHSGKTPPCTEALIAAKVKKVVIACLDPNPLVQGKGIAALQAAGIEVELGLLENEARSLNEIFFHYMTHQRPFVIAKWAMSLDGKTTPHLEDSPTISCPEADNVTHLLRQQADAILVGANTARIDNPLLTVRTKQLAPNFISHPLRVILVSETAIPLDLHIFDPTLPGRTLVAATIANSTWLAALAKKNVEVLILPKTEDNRVDLDALLAELGKQGITSLLVEGGMTVHHEFLQKNLVNKVQVTLAPVLIGTMNKKKLLTEVRLTQTGCDYQITANIGATPHAIPH